MYNVLTVELAGWFCCCGWFGRPAAARLNLRAIFILADEVEETVEGLRGTPSTVTTSPVVLGFLPVWRLKLMLPLLPLLVAGWLRVASWFIADFFTYRFLSKKFYWSRQTNLPNWFQRTPEQTVFYLVQNQKRNYFKYIYDFKLTLAIKYQKLM